MRVGVAASCNENQAELLEELSKEIGDMSPGFVAFHCSALLDLDHARQALQRLYPDAQIHGGTSCQGVMTDKGIAINDGKGAGIFCLEDEAGDFGTVTVPISDNPARDAYLATMQAIEKADRVGEAPELVWLSVCPGAEEAVLKGIEDVVGQDVPIVGGTAADNDIAGGWRVFDAGAVYENGITISVLFTSGRVSCAFHNGYARTGTKGRATRVEGRRIYEIEGRPAYEVYQEWSPEKLPTLDPAKIGANGMPILAQSTFAPFGRDMSLSAASPFSLLAHPAFVHADGSIEVFADISQGELLYLMEGSADSLVKRAGRVARLARETSGVPGGQTVYGALMVYCAGCMMAVTERLDEVAIGVARELEGIPFLGIFTFGEQGASLRGSNLHGNLMISCMTFGE